MFGKAVTYSAGILFALLMITAAMPAQAAVDDAQILHLLNRISFGPAPGDIERVRQMGIDAYIEQQLHPENSFEMPVALQQRLEQLPTINESIAELAERYGPPPGGNKQMTQEERKEFEARARTVLQELSEAKILRAVASPAQLQEVMTDFWFNHFNVFFGKGADKIFISSYERDAIRPYALGKFQDLLEATAHHPAMLFYLDNWENTDPDSRAAQVAAIRTGKQLGINENYARELMELHTLGVNGGYTQDDVTVLAHILTGWGLSHGKKGEGLAGRAAFAFDPNRHDFSNQLFLGEVFKGGGEDEIERVLYLLAHHPSTARHISYELAQYFVADDPPQSLVDRLTQTFRQTDGNIADVLRVLFQSEEFWDPQYTQAKFKPPFRFVVSALRANGIFPPGDTKQLQGAIAQMGEPLYRCQTPNGYSNTNSQWLNSDAVLKRVDFAKKLGQFVGRNAPQTIEAALGNNWSANTVSTVRNSPEKLQTALLLGSPEFVYY